MRRLLLVALLVCPPAAAETMTSFIVHAWVPELGPPSAGTPIERRLAQVASLALDGRLRSAAATLDATSIYPATPRERVLIALFRYQLSLRRYRYIGGAILLNNDVLLDARYAAQLLLFQQAFAPMNELPMAERGDGMAAAEWSGVLPVMLDIPAMLRQRAFSNPNDYATGVQQLDAMLSMGKQRLDAAFRGAAGMQLLSPSDIAVLQHLLAANEARARRDLAGARRELDAAIAVATPAGAAELRVDRGDVIFRYGDALLMGHDGALAGLLVTDVLTQGDFGLAALPDAEIQTALRDWEIAEKALGPAPRLLVRRADVRVFGRDFDGALRLLAEAARAEGIVGWAAAAAKATFEGSRLQLLAAVARARAEENIGAVASFAETARIEGAFAGMLGNTPRASALLEAAADAHGDDAPRMRAETLLQLTMYYDTIGRPDAAIVAGNAARDAHRRFLSKAEKSAAQAPSGQPAVDLAEERKFAGRIELALGFAHATRSIATGSATAGALAEASFAEADKIFRDNPTPDEDLSLMSANVVARSITFAIDQARRRHAPCDELRDLYAMLRARAEKARMSDFVLSLDFSLPDCNPERLAEDRRQLEGRDLVAPLRARLAASSSPVGARALAERIEANKTLVTLQLQMDLLGTAGAWSALERTAVSLGELVRGNDSLRSLVPYAEGQRMAALNGQGKYGEALRIEDDLHRNWWGAMVPQLRAGVLGVALSAEAGLCATRDPTCDPIRGLLAFERLWFEDRRAGVLRTGVQPLLRTTAERAALEARLANGGVLSDAEAVRLGELRGDGSEAILREPEPSRDAIEKVIAMLPLATRVIVFAPARDRLLVFQARRGKASLASVAAKPWEIAAAATALEYAITDRVEEAIAPAASAASAWFHLLDPPLEPGETLAIVAPYPLARTPFDVVRVNGRLLAVEHPILYADHLGTVADRAPAAGGNASALIAGVNGNGLASAEAEAAEIARILGATPFLGADVTPAAVRERLPTARIIHFALHASLVSENPYDSYLSFGSEGRLRAWELFRSAPAAELISLSACDTGAESARPFMPGTFGGSPTSLMSFAFAGNARFVVASFWRVKDSVGTRVMVDFYRFLHEGSTPPAALARVKQALIAEGKPAYYYANFFVAMRSVGAITKETP
jgi:hypothetical protein